MKIFGIAGWSGSGKTTLIKALIPVLSGRGVSVGTIKHSHHPLSLDPSVEQPGAVETLVASPDRFALTGAFAGDDDGRLPWLAGRMAGFDLLLVEGFKFFHHPRLEVWNSALGKPLLAAADDRIVALAGDRRPAASVAAIPWFQRDDIAAIADFVQKSCLTLDQLRR